LALRADFRVYSFRTTRAPNAQLLGAAIRIALSEKDPFRAGFPKGSHSNSKQDPRTAP
jgi:hypothetical protein